MTLTPEQRIQRFKALVEAAIEYTGVNLKAVVKRRELGDVLQLEAELAFVLVKDWQPEQIEYPTEDNDNETPTPVPASANGAHAG